MAILSKACKPDNFESHNSLKLSFTNIRGLHSNFVDCESFVESNSSDILALYETNLDDLIQKDSKTHIHGLAVYVKEGLPFVRDFLLHRFFLMFSTDFTSLNVLLLFPLSITFFVFGHGF